jgi:two-component system C4-dicarboxylate transport sensor histidine kinase DctB
MGAITRQLKSYARKGGEAFDPWTCARRSASALSMMEPQLKRARSRSPRNLPRRPVMVMGDRMRLEQVMINLLRNALDATKAVTPIREIDPAAAGETAVLTVRDNGRGSRISSAVRAFLHHQGARRRGRARACDFVGDRLRPGRPLTARNGPRGGAVFEMQAAAAGEEEPRMMRGRREG